MSGRNQIREDLKSNSFILSSQSVIHVWGNRGESVPGMRIDLFVLRLRVVITVTLSFPDNLGRAMPSASWSDSAARSVIHAQRFRNGLFSSRALKDLAAGVRLRGPWHSQRTLVLAVFAQLRKYATIAGRVRPNR